MTTIRTVADVFTNYAARTGTALEFTDERRLICAASFDADQQAHQQLLEQYAPGIRNIFARVTNPIRQSLSPEDLEDLQMEALMAFLEAINKAADDDTTRVAAFLESSISNALREHQAVRLVVTVPARSLRRYNTIMAKAGNNLMEATRIAHEFSMSPETLVSIAEAVSRSQHVELDAPAGDSPEGESRGALTAALQPAVEDVIETHHVASAARAAIDGRESDVVDHIYGFTTSEQAMSERDAAYEMGLSKTTVHRAHHSALTTMRSAVGAA